MEPTMNSSILELAGRVLRNQARVVANTADVLGEAFVQAVHLISSCTNRLVLTGVGKSGFVARQIAATFVRTGMPSLFVHPTDAVHGDLGAIAGDDLVLAVSNSGHTSELLHLLPHLRKRSRSILAIVGTPGSPLVKEVDLALCLGEVEDPLVGGPIGSSLASLALADALALAVMQFRALPRDVLVQNHPGGSGVTFSCPPPDERVLSLAKAKLREAGSAEG
jgi:arabinose-5-phosphate isomerase